MKKPLFAIILPLVLFSCQNQTKDSDSQIFYKSIDSLLQKSISDWNVPGLAVGIIADDTIFLSKGYGVIHVDKPLDVTDTTLFGIASLTKAFTATGIGIAQKQGLLSIYDPIKKHLKQFETANDTVTKTITFYDVLSHQTGFSTFSGDLSWYGSNKSKAEVIELIKYVPIKNSPQSEYGYSNIMYLVAGVALEEAVNQKYEDYINANLLSPLKMGYTTFNYSEVIKLENIANPHIIVDKENKPINYIDWTNISPAGGLFSNIKDLTKWAKFQWNFDSTIVDREFINIQQSVITSQKLNMLDNIAPDIIKNKGYGLGWDVLDFNNYKVIMHNGGLDGMTSQIVIIPEKKTAFILLANTSTPLPIVLSYELLYQFLVDINSPYYKIVLEKYNSFKGFEIEQDTTLSPQKPDLETLKGKYIDKLMGEVVIYENTENQTIEIQFVSAPHFDGVINVSDDGDVKIIWQNIISLPDGLILINRSENGAVTSFNIKCPNPDFHFEEINFVKIN
jgi:CubicO group peptidase (beta-lactamase class C family)